MTDDFNLDSAEVGMLVRTRNQGVFQVKESKAWGRYLAKVPDPGGVSLPKNLLENFKVKNSFPKLPAEKWAAYLALCFYMCPEGRKMNILNHDDQLEVAVCLLRDQATLSEWKIVVPRQIVSGGRVDADLRKSVDILTGEEYNIFPPMGWLHAGSSHSHNTMPAFFSSIDDASELNVPGLHIVVGEIDHRKMEYSHVASIVHQKQRKNLEIEEVVDVTPVENPFHPKVLDYVKAVSQTIKFRSRKKKRNLTDDPGGRSTPTKHLDSIKSHPWIPPTTDEDGKINSFYFGLDKYNSDLYDDLQESPKYLSDDEMKALIEKDISVDLDSSDIAMWAKHVELMNALREDLDEV